MQWLKSRYRLLLEAINSSLAIDRDVVEQAVAANIVRILWTAPIISFAQILAALAFGLREPSLMPAEITWHKCVVSANLTMALINIIIALGAWLMRKKVISCQVKSVFVYTVISYVLFAGLLISLIDQLVTPNISPLIISIAIVGAFYYVPPKNSFLIFMALFLCFRYAFIAYANNSVNILASNLTNGLVASLVGFSLSMVNWQHFHKLKTQQKSIARQQELLKQMAYQDSLTGLPNRRWLDELMHGEVALVQRNQVEACLLFLDIDNFKQINDTYGHSAGDTLLRDFARLLQENLHDNNILARLGGEEFIILARNTSMKQCTALAERLRRIIAEQAFMLGQHKIKITASIGVASLQGLENTNTYYSTADQALYQAKQSGRNRVVVFDSPEGEV